MSSGTVVSRVDGPVATVCLDAPPLNLLNAPLYEALDDAFGALAVNEAVRVIVITGAGKRAFSAGADIREFARRRADPPAWRRDLTRIHEVFTGIEECPKATIAALNGLAYGGGLELALACDLRVVADDARLALPEIKLGEFPASGGTQRLPRLIGLARAKSFMLLGEPITAAEARTLGLVDRVVPSDEVTSAARAMAETLATRSGVAVAALKRALHEGLQRPLAAGLALEVDLMEALSRSVDASEGYQAFLGKRQPRFIHR